MIAQSLCLVYIFLPFLVSAELPILASNRDYESGKLGLYPLQKFESIDVVAPRPNLVRDDSRCSRNMKTFLSPRIAADPLAEARAAIMDHRGHLVWSSDWENKDIHNVMAQEYQGKSYITFWAGSTERNQSYGAGTFYMLDETYNLSRRVHAAKGLKADFHEFRITPQDTAILVAYDVQNYDLSKFGKPAGPILDCVVQEVDIESGDLLFEWRASDHVEMTLTERAIRNEGEPGLPFDWFHINSVDKDAQGNFLIASNHLNSLLYVEGETKETLWVLGGRGTTLQDLSNGEASMFLSPQDARLSDDGTEVTAFDGGNSWSNKGGPRGVKLRVNPAEMTVKFVAEYRLPDRELTGSHGSMQVLPNGNVFMGYGSSGIYAEFSPGGERLCEVQFAPQMKSGASLATSYRVLKFDWHALPTTAPDLVLSQDDAKRAYASWHGATEVSSWRLEGRGEDGGWQHLARASGAGFEASFVLKPGHGFLRAVALDRRGKTLGTSEPLNATADAVTGRLDADCGHRQIYETIIISSRPIFDHTSRSLGLMVLVCLLLAARALRRRRERILILRPLADVKGGHMV